ncbi:MAG: hypothetical protein WA418_00445, partial [Bradyrhizobium sp.]
SLGAAQEHDAANPTRSVMALGIGQVFTTAVFGPKRTPHPLHINNLALQKIAKSRFSSANPRSRVSEGGKPGDDSGA